MIGPKVAVWRSEPYRRYVASHECFGCRISGYSQCAHGNTGKGRGTKVCDSRTFPLCCARVGMIGCHAQFDLCIDMDRNERRELEDKHIAEMQARAKADGWKLPGAAMARAA